MSPKIIVKEKPGQESDRHDSQSDCRTMWSRSFSSSLGRKLPLIRVEEKPGLSYASIEEKG